ncbi:hypothetical protein BDV29DRAFT_167674 [Aspergillus leporis]|jgi:hypothetical protein|uniref:BZIP domain-containing protein n=1 Tax=Aspergillus leporis TaxID=41062 RepID=A0A5N5XEB7_9EURO|nr:hypothetical protein BDV29DRAFT_167674 [Aspergillus leporis]
MSVNQTLYSRTRQDAACAGPTAFNPTGTFSQSDLMAFSLPEDESMWGFNPISPTMPSWQGKMEPQAFCPPTLERDLKNTHVRNGQPTPPPFDDKKLQQGDVYALAQYSYNSPPPAFTPQRQSRSFSDQSPRSYGGSARRRKSEGSGQNQEREKREKFLERNRLAASKCRQKKKEHTKLLEDRYKEVSTKHNELQAERARLHNEWLNLRDEMLKHTNCDDEAMRLYHAQSVRDTSKKYSQGTTPRGISQDTPPHKMAPSPSLAFGFDGPLLSTDMDVTLDPNPRRGSELSMITESSYEFATDDSFNDLINV